MMHIETVINPILDGMNVTAIDEHAMNTLKNAYMDEIRNILSRALEIAKYCFQSDEVCFTTNVVAAALPYMAHSSGLSKEVFKYVPSETLSKKGNRNRKLHHLNRHPGKFFAEPSIFCNYLVQTTKDFTSTFKFSKNAVLIIQTHVETLIAELLTSSVELSKITKGVITEHIMKSLIGVRKQATATHPRVRKTGDFTPYIYEILKQVHPNKSISLEAIYQINAFCNHLLLCILDGVHMLNFNFTENGTLDSEMLSAAIKIMIGGELSKHAILEMNKASIRLRNHEKNSRAASAGLQLNVSVVEGAMEMKATDDVLVQLSAVLEYFTAEFLELSGNQAIDSERRIIQLYHIVRAVNIDVEFRSLLPKLGFKFIQGGISKYIDHEFPNSEIPNIIRAFHCENNKVTCDKKYLSNEDYTPKRMLEPDVKVYDDSAYNAEVALYREDVIKFNEVYENDTEEKERDDDDEYDFEDDISDDFKI